MWQTKLDATQENVLLEHHIDTLQNTLYRKQKHITKLLVTCEKQMLTNEQKLQMWWQKFEKFLSQIHQITQIEYEIAKPKICRNKNERT